MARAPCGRARLHRCGGGRGGCPGPPPRPGTGGGRRGVVSDTFGGRVDRPQWWTVIKTRAKSYPHILGLAARQEAALCAQPEKAEERGIAARRTDDPGERGGEAGKEKPGEGRKPGVWRRLCFRSVWPAVSHAAESLCRAPAQGRQLCLSGWVLTMTVAGAVFWEWSEGPDQREEGKVSRQCLLRSFTQRTPRQGTAAAGGRGGV